MRRKNYYKTLGVDAGASTDEIRKAYRQLALKYHPDKNNGDELSARQFQEIHEAYHTLSDPQRRSAYNQKTWFHKHSFRKHAEPVTPYLFFTKASQLSIFLDKLHPADVNKTALGLYLKHLLSNDNLNILKTANDHSVNREVIVLLLKASERLPAKESSLIALKLKQIADADTNPFINERIKALRFQLLWERYQFLIILVVTLFICLIIYLLSAYE